MNARAATTRDWEIVKRMHEGMRYGFELPEGLKGVHVVEEDGTVLAAAGYELAAQIVAVVNPVVFSPMRRLAAIKTLHAPLAKEVLAHDIKSVYAFCEPQDQSFTRRLMQ